MLATSDTEVGESWVHVVQHIQASRYLSAAGLVFMLYDHLLTFGDEVEYVWSSRWTLPKGLFLFVRYLVPTAMIINSYQMSGLSQMILPDIFCVVWLCVAAYLGLITIAISNFIVLLRLWVLWDRNRRLMAWTILYYVLTQIATIACSTIVIGKMIPAISFQKTLGICILSDRAHIALFWAPGIFFEVMVFITTFWNAVGRPQDRNSPFVKAMYRDGLAYFMILFSLRMTNLLLALFAPLSLIFLGCFFIWASTTVTLTRLVLNLRRMSYRAGIASGAHNELGTPPYQQDI